MPAQWRLDDGTDFSEASTDGSLANVPEQPWPDQLSDCADVVKKGTSLVARDECHGIERRRSATFPFQKPGDSAKGGKALRNHDQAKTKSSSTKNISWIV